jgi:hypothetical protein
MSLVVRRCGDVTMYGLEPIPARVHERLFVRYDAINSVHMQVLLHRTRQSVVGATRGG